MTKRFNPAPGWPIPPEGWFPPEGWQPDPTWPAAPEGWELVVEVEPTDAEPKPRPRRGRVRATARGARDAFDAQNAQSSADLANEPGVIWAAKGQPLAGFGAGRYRLTATTLFFEKGVLATDAQQVPIVHVLDVDMRQSITQKGRGVGDVLVHVRRQNGVEVVTLENVPDPRRAVSILNDTAHQARLASQKLAQTYHHTTQNAAPVSVEPPVSSEAPNRSDPVEQLRRLGELRDSGILTEAEFTAKKAEILARL
jgi:hypothetical protein